jgi:hypothetical protein
MPTNFEVGGYILVGMVQRQILPKLVSWQRPVSATDFEIEQVLGVENRLRGQRNCVHCTTGNLCHDASLGASEELQRFQQYQASTFICLRSVCMAKGVWRIASVCSLFRVRQSGKQLGTGRVDCEGCSRHAQKGLFIASRKIYMSKLDVCSRDLLLEAVLVSWRCFPRYKSMTLVL